MTAPLENRYYTCECFSSGHYARVVWNEEKDPAEASGWLELHGTWGDPMEDDTSLLGWWRRIKAAWAMLRHRHYNTVEISLEPSVARQLAAELVRGAEATEQWREYPAARPASQEVPG